MHKLRSLNQNGNMIVNVISVLLILSLAGFGIWAYMNYLDQRDNTDQKITAAIEEANQELTAELEAEFAEELKQPFQTYTSPRSTGSVRITYPKTWSGYVNEDEGANNPLSATFHPNVIPATNTLYALRVAVDGKPYDRIVDGYGSNVEDGVLKSRPIKVSGTTGVYLEGELAKDIEGAMVIFSIRDKTLRVWTQSLNFKSDFDKVVNKLRFQP